MRSLTNSPSFGYLVPSDHEGDEEATLPHTKPREDFVLAEGTEVISNEAELLGKLPATLDYT